jgi:hypothetical protein
MMKRQFNVLWTKGYSLEWQLARGGTAAQYYAVARTSGAARVRIFIGDLLPVPGDAAHFGGVLAG